MQQNDIEKYYKIDEGYLFESYCRSRLSLPKRIHIFLICLGYVSPFTDRSEIGCLTEYFSKSV